MPSRKGSARKKTIDRLNHRQDLKQAEEARKESEENFRILFDENPLPTLLSEMPSGTIAFVNKRMAATVGMDPKDIIGKTGNDLGLLKNPGDEEKLTKLIACQGLVDNVEIEGVLPEGRPGTDLVSMRLVTIKGKKYCLTVIQDITERKRAEEALQRSGTLFSSAFRMSPAATILSMLQDGMCIDANEAYARLVGFSREELLGRTTTELNIWMSPGERERIVSGLARSGRLRNVPITLRKKDGSFCSTLASGEIITIEDKQCILSFFYDITERKQAEEALSRSQERYRLLYEYAPVGILLVNRSGQILEVNSATIQILGSPSAEATKGINILTFPLLIEAGISEAFRRCVETGQVVFGEYPYITKWEKSIHMQLRFVPIFDDRHQVNLVHTIIENITERKRMEEELQKAQKLESLGVLAGGIAHDFNNLLAGIFGNIDLARSVSKDPRVTGHLEATIATMGRARALTLQLLTFAKGGSPVQKTTPLVPFIQDSAHFALSGSNISCRFFLAGDLRPCNIDKNQIGQVIDNIVINAQQAMPNGGAIEIKAENRAFGEKEHPPLAETEKNTVAPFELVAVTTRFDEQFRTMGG